MRVTAEVTEQMEVTAAEGVCAAELDKELLPASLAKLPVNCTLEAVAEDVGHGMGPKVIAGQRGMKLLVLEEAMMHPLQTEAAAVAVVTQGQLAEPVALASCASGCTRKRNNKLKGERLCTTL